VGKDSSTVETARFFLPASSVPDRPTCQRLPDQFVWGKGESHSADTSEPFLAPQIEGVLTTPLKKVVRPRWVTVGTWFQRQTLACDGRRSLAIPNTNLPFKNIPDAIGLWTTRPASAKQCRARKQPRSAQPSAQSRQAHGRPLIGQIVQRRRVDVQDPTHIAHFSRPHCPDVWPSCFF
jgi:hypothetical protein